MKIILLSFSDYKGGANIAAYSIFKSLKKKNINFLRSLEILIIKLFLKKNFHQSLNIFKSYLKSKINEINPDILNIHWINRSTISLNEINELDCKIVISLHDMWFLNSTEHYFLKKENNLDYISSVCLKKKREIVKKKGVYFIAHNRWMLNKFKKTFPKYKSKIYLCNYYPIDLDFFKPRNKKKLRNKYNLPKNKKIVLYSAQDVSDNRKGYKYFLEIVNKLKNNSDIFFLSIGKNFNNNNFTNLKQLDYMEHNKISEIYSLSDIFICTSIIDNLPLTILEALSSGNVVFSYKNGGSEEILKNIGYTFNINEKNKLITKLNNLSTNEIKKKSKLSRLFANKNFDKKKISIQYRNIYKHIN